ncbi:hypothetical protein [Streptomyces roseolus]|uniref:hypothetical protein n=1 Tax=Streptomyces roseolus TaxID=67358 RepID=UPI00167B097A|nr:hypothetical protein [Streptomyces roseolus]GGR54538.1 hypothetical protein GCM10010282_54470 [Streptomyces roseolus]
MSDPAEHDAEAVLAGFWEDHRASGVPEEERDPRVTAAVEELFGERPGHAETLAPSAAGRVWARRCRRARTPAGRRASPRR